MAFCLLLALPAAHPSPVHAQAPPPSSPPTERPATATRPAEPGDRIRLRTAAQERFVGTLLEVTPDVLRVQDGADVVRVPRASIDTLERSLGKHRRFWRHFLVTTGVGAAAVGLLVAALEDAGCSDGPFGCMGPGGTFILGAGVGAVVSLPIAVVVGVAVRSERWEPAAPARGGSTR